MESQSEVIYPLTKPITSAAGVMYRIAVIADLDKQARRETSWVSYLHKGYLTWNPKTHAVSIAWDEDNRLLTSQLNAKGRGMELSELNVFGGKLYTCCDKTGVLYEIMEDGVRPFVTIRDGDGSVDQGFKCEWGTVKDGLLYIGGHGTEVFNREGKYVHNNNEWVKIVSSEGNVEHMNWHDNYKAIRSAVGVESPGYITHEACNWSRVHNKWFFLPRKVSHEMFQEDKDESAASNLLIVCDENFKNIEIIQVGQVVPTHGFSSFKFIPGTGDTAIVAIKSKEHGGETASYIMVFNIDGEIFLEETKFTNKKYEGIEFV